MPLPGVRERLARRGAPVRNTNGPELVLWIEGGWRCEFWLVESRGQLRLYCDNELYRTLEIGGGVAFAVAQEWRTIILCGAAASQRPLGSRWSPR